MVATRLKQFLSQGMSPHKIALCVALGSAIGLIPLLGTSMFICAGVALALRLNPAAIQVANYAVYPVQLALVGPYYLAGAWIFGADPALASVGTITELLREDFLTALTILWDLILYAVIVWLVSAAATALVIYAIVVRLARRLAGSNPAEPAAPPATEGADA